MLQRNLKVRNKIFCVLYRFAEKSLMKYSAFFLLFSLLMVSCNEDETVTCTTCTSSESLPFEVCRESNGNASVNGEDTETNYEVYLDGLIEAGANCGR